jgi:ribose transport system permease protein
VSEPAERTANAIRDLPRRAVGSQLLQSMGPLLALVVVVLGFTLADYFYGQGRFSEMRNIRVVLTVTAPVAVAALGMTLIIISGGIDLSAGTASMLCATVLACALRADFPVVAAVALALATGAACGLLNGLLIGTLRIPPFIVTLGTMTIFLGLAKRMALDWAGATTVSVNRELIPTWLMNLTSTMRPDWFGWVPNIASGVWLALAIAALVAALLRFTVFGRHLYALGSSEATARLCGVNILWTKVWVYVVAGLLLGAAGIYSFSLVKSATPIEGIGKELKFIAAVVIGGASLSGGRGSVLGTLAGAAIMGVITSGCDQLGIQNATQDMIIGLIIIAAVTLDRFRQRKQEA